MFHIADEHQAKTVAARMIDRVHEIANLPEFECDVDVSVELAWDEGGEPLQGRPGDGATGGPPPEGRPVKP